MSDFEFRCLEPELRDLTECGEKRGLAPAVQKQWRLHLEVCHACRDELETRRALTGLLGEGVGMTEEVIVAAHAGPSKPRRVAAREAWGGAVLSLAAGLALVFMMSPHQKTLVTRGFGGADRGDMVFLIERPVEGEVIGETGGSLEWTEVERANSYRVTVETMDGESLWTGMAKASKIDLPSESEKPGTYMAIVEPIPHGLVDEDHADVAFTRSGIASWFAYRLAHAANLSLIPLALALVFAGWAIYRRN